MSYDARCVAVVYFFVTGKASDNIDHTIEEFYPVHEHCIVTSPNAFQDIRNCEETEWSSNYPDPKSEFPSFVRF